MRLVIVMVFLCFVSCRRAKLPLQLSQNIAGEYVLKSNKLYQALSDQNYHSLLLAADGSYLLKKAEMHFSPVIEQCAIASKGTWAVVADDVIELWSEENYSHQKGFEYELNKQNTLSADSLYFTIYFSKDYEPDVKVHVVFNNNVSTSIVTDKTSFALRKSDFLWPKSTSYIQRNYINLYFTSDLSIHSRRIFKIFEQDIDTEKSNFLTITLPHFDRCFLEFEPLNKELLYKKNKNQLYWQGEIWEKID